jgi:ribosomal protein L25 (general stress protein Ctc)
MLAQITLNMRGLGAFTATRQNYQSLYPTIHQKSKTMAHSPAQQKNIELLTLSCIPKTQAYIAHALQTHKHSKQLDHLDVAIVTIEI